MNRTDTKKSTLYASFRILRRGRLQAVRAAILVLLVFVAAGTAGCGSPAASGEDQRFRSFTRECFKEYASVDSIRLHFTLADPSRYDLTEKTVSFRDISKEALKEDCSRARSLLKELHSFDRSGLSEENSLTYDIFERKLEQTVSSEDYILYQSYLGASGLVSQIPVSLSEYYFDDENDIKNYLALLSSLPDLFDQMVRFEKERNKAGFYCPSFMIDNTIEQIDHFLAGSEEDQLLLTTFEERVRSLESLSEDQKRTWINNNRALFEQVVIPEYRSLRKTLASWDTAGRSGNPVNSPEDNPHNAPDGSQKNNPKDGLKSTPETNPERLCQYEKGRALYDLLLKSNVGTDKSPEDCITFLEEKIKEIVSGTAALNASREDLYADYLAMTPALSDPEEILDRLKSDIRRDFPDLENVPCSLNYLPASLSGTSAAAFYLIPPVDSTDYNIIYINQDHVENKDLFSTLAHEGYPGHLYQTNYFVRTDPDPLRYLIKTPGYDEGWGTYAQLFSYEYMAFKDTDRETAQALKKLCRSNDLLSLSLSALSDLYVNYMDYDRQALAKWLSAYGIEEENASAIYDYVVENPVVWPEYCLGCFELEDLKSDYAKKEGDAFDLTEFHKKVLDCGSCPFDLLRVRILP